MSPAAIIAGSLRGRLKPNQVSPGPMACSRCLTLCANGEDWMRHRNEQDKDGQTECQREQNTVRQASGGIR